MPYITIRPRRGTASEWFEENPVLEKGEFVVEVPGDGVGTGSSKFKVGDGKTAYSGLPYALDFSYEPTSFNGGNVEDFCILQIKAATQKEWYDENPKLKSREIGYDTTRNILKVGDGVHKWNNLKPLKASFLTSNDLDFGDEDMDIPTAESIVTSNHQYKTKCLPNGWDNPITEEEKEKHPTGGVDVVTTAGINDLLNSD